MKHTPGPWQAEGNEIWHRGNGYNDESDQHTYICDVVHPANRSLIVAAPDLLEACEKALKTLKEIKSFCGEGLEVYGWHQNGDPEPFEHFIEENMESNLLELLKVAISKAKGEGA